MKDEVRLNIKLSADLLKRIKVVAEAKSLTVSALTRLLLINYVEQVENDRKNKESKN